MKTTIPSPNKGMRQFFRELGVLFFVLSDIALTMTLVGLPMEADAKVASHSDNNNQMVAHHSQGLDEIESRVPGSTPRLRSREEILRRDMIVGFVLSIVTGTCGLMLFGLGTRNLDGMNPTGR